MSKLLELSKEVLRSYSKKASTSVKDLSRKSKLAGNTAKRIKSDGDKYSRNALTKLGGRLAKRHSDKVAKKVDQRKTDIDRTIAKRNKYLNKVSNEGLSFSDLRARLNEELNR